MELVNEKELCNKLGIVRKTMYFWRLQGLPYQLFINGHIHYMYDVTATREWMKQNKKGKYKNK